MRSWWPAALVVVVITLLVAGLPWGRLQAPGEPLYVVVPETDLNLLGGATAGESGAADEELALVASSVHTALLRGLLGLRGVAVLESPRHTDSWDDATSLARVAGAGEVLVSRLECGGRNCQVVLRRLRGEDGEILWTESFSVDNRQLLSTSQAVLGHLRQGYSERSVREGVAELEAQSADYEEYLRVRYRYEQRQEGYSVDELLRDLERIEQTSPRFLMPSLLRIKVLVRRFQEQRHADDLLAAKSALERARSLAPHDPQVLARAVQLARIDNRLDDAWSYLEELKLLEPGNALALLHEARLLERQGRNEEAVAIMREAVQRIPSVDYYSDLADLLYRQGDVDGARQSLEQGLTRAPDSFSARSRLAQIELLSGSAARAAELYEELVRRSPEVTELTNLGTAYLLMQRNSEAAEQFRRAFELGPSSPYAALNLADAELLLGNEQEAAQLYERVVELADADPQPDMLLTVRAQAEAHLGRHEDAVASVQTALRRSPDNPQTLYEAALVYALVGDLASALVNARQALRQGIEPRWFSFSWFDELRPHLALADA